MKFASAVILVIALGSVVTGRIADTEQTSKEWVECRKQLGIKDREQSGIKDGEQGPFKICSTVGLSFCYEVADGQYRQFSAPCGDHSFFKLVECVAKEKGVPISQVVPTTECQQPIPENFSKNEVHSHE